ncbi:MAG: lysylphosphatidylglycerol synthase transmembrane domain-containing protein [Longimicrobiales bacterium]
MTLRRWLRRLLPPASLAVGLVVIGVVACRSGQSPADLLRALPAHAHLLALGIMLADLGARVGRWLLLAKGIGVPLRARTAVAAQLAGEAAGAMTPARLGADPTKLMVAARDARSVAGPGALLVGEAFAEGVALTVLVTALFFFAPRARGLPLLGVMGYALFLVGVGTAVLMAARNRPGRERPRWLKRLRLPRDRWRQFRVLVRHLRVRAGRLERLPVGRGAAVLAVTAVHIAARLAVLPVLALSAGATGPLLLLVLWPLFFFYVAILVPSPGGGGTVEVGFALALGGTVVGPSVAALLIWWRFYTFYLGALIGGVVLAALGAFGRRPAPRSGAADYGPSDAAAAGATAGSIARSGAVGAVASRRSSHSRQAE